MEKMVRIGILFGGRSGEHDVSLMSARSVLKAIDRDKYDITLIGITKEGRWIGGDDPMRALENGSEGPETLLIGAPHYSALMQIGSDPARTGVTLADMGGLDVIFPLLHGSFGEDGAIQGLFELADIAYVGAGVVGSAVGMDKGIFKSVMRACGLPILPYLMINRSALSGGTDRVIADISSELAFPVFVKPANLGSSVGISMAKDAAELHVSLVEAARWDRRLIVERGINGREIEVSVLGNDDPQVSIAGEIVPGSNFYDYMSKYVRGDSELLIPAPITERQQDQVQEFAVTAFKAVDCSGMARVDFLLDKLSGELWLNEINTIPGFTEISMYPRLWEASGLKYPELIDRLIELALERKVDRDKTQRKYQPEG